MKWRRPKVLEQSRDAIPHRPILPLLAEGKNVVKSRRGNLLHPGKCSRSFRENPRRRRPICGKRDTPTVFMYPPMAAAGSTLSVLVSRGCGGSSRERRLDRDDRGKYGRHEGSPIFSGPAAVTNCPVCTALNGGGNYEPMKEVLPERS